MIHPRDIVDFAFPEVPTPEPRSAVRSLILVPALLTLAVTLVRLAGELGGGSAILFNRDAGGPGALVGIVWLIPVFGAWFAIRLARAGAEPLRLAPVFGWVAAAFALNMALGGASIALYPKSPVVQLAVFGVGSIAAIAVARRGWPALWKVLLAYAFAARVPVLVIMFLAIFRGWDSHYAKPRPDFPPMGPWGLFGWTAFLPQMTVWIYVTVVGGLLFGALAVAVRRMLVRAPAGATVRP